MILLHYLFFLNRRKAKKAAKEAAFKGNFF